MKSHHARILNLIFNSHSFFDPKSFAFNQAELRWTGDEVSLIGENITPKAFVRIAKEVSDPTAVLSRVNVSEGVYEPLWLVFYSAQYDDEYPRFVNVEECAPHAVSLMFHRPDLASDCFVGKRLADDHGLLESERRFQGPSLHDICSFSLKIEDWDEADWLKFLEVGMN